MPFYGPRIVTEGLLFCLDAGNTKSYPGTGTAWSDLCGKHSVTLPTNKPDYSSSNLGCFVFNGSSDYIYMNDYYLGGGRTVSEMSVFSWMKTTQNNGTPGVWDNRNWSILDFDRSDAFTFTVTGAGQVEMSGRSSNNGNISGSVYYDIVGNQQVNDGVWHYIGWTFSVANQEIVMYVDGKVDKVFAANGSMTALGSGSTRYGIIGDGSEATSPNGNRNNIYFSGSIATIQFYNTKVLAPTDVMQNFNANRGRFEV